MNISVRFFNPSTGDDHTVTDLPLNLGEEYFSKLYMRNGAEHISMRSLVDINEKPPLFANGLKHLEFPIDKVTLEYRNSWVTVNTVGKDLGEVYRTHRRYCELLATQAYLVAGHVVIRPKILWVARVLAWFFSKFSIEIAIQPVPDKEIDLALE